MARKLTFQERVQEKIDVDAALARARRKAERGGLIITGKGQREARKALEATVKRRRKK